MATRITFEPETQLAVKPQRVYLKNAWADDWVQIEHLWCSEAVWTASPTIPTAQLLWRYGIALGPGTQAWLNRLRQQQRFRWFVKVEFDVHPLTDGDEEIPLRWFGTLEVEQDAFHGILRRTVAGASGEHRDGEQHLTCYGLEGLLELTWVTSSAVRTTDEASIYTVKRGLTFNERDEVRGGDSTGNCHTTSASDDFAVFHHSLTGGTDWSTWTCVQYLLRQHAPRDLDDTRKLELFCFDGDGALPQWDRPRIPTHGKNVKELLDTLIPRQRLLAWKLRPQEAGSPAGDDSLVGESIELVPFTFAAEDIDLTGAVSGTPAPGWLGSAVFKANPNQFEIDATADRGAQVQLQLAAGDLYDRVRVLGARRTSTATFSYFDGTLDRGWSFELEAAYDLAAVGAADYPAAADVELRQWRNQQARQQEKFRPVYARFVLPDGFNYLVGDGVSGLPDQPLTPDREESDTVAAEDVQPVKLAPEDLHFLPYTLLKTGYDYSGTKVADGAVTETTAGREHERQPPLVIFPTQIQPGGAGDKTYRLADKAGLAANYETASQEYQDRWSARVRVDHDQGALWVEVTNDEQYAIAKTTFVGQPEDYGASADYKEMLCTCSVAWSDHVEILYPESLSAGDVAGDAIREVLIEAGEGYRLDWLVKHTVVGITPETGKPIRAEAGGWLADDRPRMQAIARLAHAWYGQVRRTLLLRTTRLTSLLEVGDYVTQAGRVDGEADLHDEVRGVITQIRVLSPRSEGQAAGDLPPPTLSLATSFGELNVLSLV